MSLSSLDKSLTCKLVTAWVTPRILQEMLSHLKHFYHVSIFQPHLGKCAMQFLATPLCWGDFYHRWVMMVCFGLNWQILWEIYSLMKSFKFESKTFLHMQEFRLALGLFQDKILMLNFIQILFYIHILTWRKKLLHAKLLLSPTCMGGSTGSSILVLVPAWYRLDSPEVTDRRFCHCSL